MKTALWAGIGLTGVALYGVIFRLYTWFKFVDPEIYFRSDYMTATTLSVFGGAAAVVGFGILVIYMYRYHEEVVASTNELYRKAYMKMEALIKERDQLKRDGETLIREIKKAKKDKGLPEELKSQLEFFDERQKKDEHPLRPTPIINPEKHEIMEEDTKKAEDERKTREAEHKKNYEVETLKKEVRNLKERDRPVASAQSAIPQQINIKQEGGCGGCLKWFVILTLSSAAIYAILMLGFCSMVTR